MHSTCKRTMITIYVSSQHHRIVYKVNWSFTSIEVSITRKFPRMRLMWLSMIALQSLRRVRSVSVFISCLSLWVWMLRELSSLHSTIVLTFDAFDFPRHCNSLESMISFIVILWRLCSFHRQSHRLKSWRSLVVRVINSANWHRSWQCWWRDHSKHEYPANSGEHGCGMWESSTF